MYYMKCILHAGDKLCLARCAGTWCRLMCQLELVSRFLPRYATSAKVVPCMCVYTNTHLVVVYGCVWETGGLVLIGQTFP